MTHAPWVWGAGENDCGGFVLDLDERGSIAPLRDQRYEVLAVTAVGPRAHTIDSARFRALEVEQEPAASFGEWSRCDSKDCFEHGVVEVSEPYPTRPLGRSFR